MPEYGNFSSTPSMNSAVNSSTSDANKQAFINQAIAWEGLSENPGDPNGFSGSYRQIINIINPNYHSAWCAVFVSACAKQAGIANIIPANTWAYGIGAGILQNGGKAIPGKASSWHCDVTPAIGDTIQFGSGTVDANGNPTQNDSDHVYHVGIVIAVDPSNRKFTSMEGNSSDKVCRNTYSFGSESIYYLARPNWEAIGGFSEPVVVQPHADGTTTVSTDGLTSYYNGSVGTACSGITVYNDVRNGTPNDRHDMTIREICYFSDRGTFTPNETDISISAINYTTLLGNLYDSFAQYYPSGYTTDTSNLGGNVRIVVDYFGNHGLNPAACVGIAACIFELSGIGTANQGRGICAWEGQYKQDMHQQVADWSTNLTGQLDFLWKDLSINYSTMMKLLNNVPISDNGARQAANRFMVSYRYTDQPQSVDVELSRSTSAQSRAAGWFNQIIIRPNTPVGAPTSVTIPLGTNLIAGNIVTSANRNSTNPIISADAQPTVAIVSSGDAQSNAMAIYTYLRTATGLSKAQACGVIANIQYESNFNPNALGDNGTSYGICQWHAGRWDNMKTWCTNKGYDWRTLEGQIYYLEYDLVSLHTSVYNKIIAQPNTAEGAYQAGYDWCYYFEIPSNKAENSRIRGNAAKTYFADSRYT